jgi:hypothetical protein
MRHLLAVALFAATFAPAAQAVCTPDARVGVCVQAGTCTHCDPHVVVDPSCEPQHPVIAACAQIDNLYVDVLDLIGNGGTR